MLSRNIEQRALLVIDIIIWIILILLLFITLYAVIISLKEYLKSKKGSSTYRGYSIDEFDIAKMDDGVYVLKKEKGQIRYCHGAKTSKIEKEVF